MLFSCLLPTAHQRPASAKGAISDAPLHNRVVKRGEIFIAFSIVPETFGQQGKALGGGGGRDNSPKNRVSNRQSALSTKLRLFWVDKKI